MTRSLASNRAVPYLLAAVAVVAGAVITFAIGDAFETRLSFIPFLLAVTAVAVVGGFGPGALATAGATVAAAMMLQPLALPAITSAGAETALLLFIVEGLAISGLGELVRRDRVAADASAASQAASLAAERHAREQAERAIARAEGLQSTAAALGRALRTDEVVEIAVRQGLERLGAGKGVAGILGRDGRTIRTLSAVGFASDIAAEWPSYDIDDDVPLAETIRTREPIILDSSEEIRTRYPSLAASTRDGGKAVVVPLLYEDRAVGGLYFRFAGPSTVGESDMPYLRTLGQQCGAAIERARLYEAETAAWAEAQDAQRRITFLSEIGDALGHAPTVEAALGEIVEHAIPNIADWASAFLLGTDGEIRLVSLAHADPARLDQVRGYLESRPPRIDDPVGAGRAIAMGEVQLITDYAAVTAGMDLPEDAREILDTAGVRSVMHCPLVGDSEVFGALALATTGDHRLEASDAAFGEEIGRRVGSALEKVRLNARIRERLRREQSIARLGQQALEHPELEPIIEAASRELAEILGADVVSVHEALQDRPVLAIAGGHGWRDGVVGRSEIPANKRSQAGYAIWSDESVVSADYEKERRFRPSPLILDHGAVSGVTTPIRAANGAWGALGVYSRRVNRFDPDDVAFLEAVANVLGSAIGRREIELKVERMVENERRAGELAQAFIGVVSHELRTPITSIYAGAKLLKRMQDGTDAATRAELTSDIEAEADRLYRLTEDLLVLTRVERRTLEISNEPVVLPRVLQRVVGSEQERWPLTSIELDVAPETPIVLGDNTYIEQLVRNLVGNAAKYSPVGSTVRVNVTTTEDEVEVRVVDEGPGLADEDAEHLFQLFYRSPRTSRKAPGAGIGLFVCDQLARAMGGRIWAANRPEGGSEFGFALQQHTAEAETGRAEPASELAVVATNPDVVASASEAAPLDAAAT